MNRVPEDRTHHYVWIIECPECKRTFCEKGKANHFIPIPVLLRRRRFIGPCWKCRMKADVKKFKEFFKNKGGADEVQGDKVDSV